MGKLLNEKKKWIGTTLLSAALLGSAGHAAEAEAEDMFQGETLTGNWFGAGQTMEKRGIAVSLGLTEAYQYSLDGGLEQGIGRHSGSYDLEIELDLETLSGIPGGMIFMLGEGSWQGGAGFDNVAVGSIFGVNDDASGERTFDITELWYQQNLLDDRLRLRVGKLDLTGGFECRGCPVAFDGNRFANDETAQFMNGALVNNPAIPFPDNGLGTMVYFEPADSWYIGIGAADGEADAREAGFSTVTDGDSLYFYIAETGMVKSFKSANGPLAGVYRFGIWNDHGPKERLDGGGCRTDDVGFYVSLDQDIFRESTENGQGLSVFARFGWADEDVNQIEQFFSMGGQYKGLLPGRDNDVTGLGIAYANLSGPADYEADSESLVEYYYNCELVPWLQLTPSLQWINNPNGDDSVGDVILAGVRVQLPLKRELKRIATLATSLNNSWVFEKTLS